MHNQVFIPTRDEFKKLLSETVETLLDRRIPTIIRRASRKAYLTTAELRELTGFSYRKQHYLRAHNKLPYCQEGRRILYSTEDVEAFMDERRVRSRESATR